MVNGRVLHRTLSVGKLAISRAMEEQNTNSRVCFSETSQCFSFWPFPTLGCHCDQGASLLSPLRPAAPFGHHRPGEPTAAPADTPVRPDLPSHPSIRRLLHVPCVRVAPMPRGRRALAVFMPQTGKKSRKVTAVSGLMKVSKAAGGRSKMTAGKFVAIVLTRRDNV